MRAQVSKWGNSLAIRLPKAAAESLSVKEGQAVDLTIEGDTVIIRSGRPRYSIEELVAQMRPGKEPESFDDVNAAPVGRELL
jgi:antitoxin MazE